MFVQIYVICGGKYPPLNGDMPVIEPLKISNTETNDSSKIESVVSIMGRLATVVENRNVRVRNSIVENSTFSQIIVMLF